MKVPPGFLSFFTRLGVLLIPISLGAQSIPADMPLGFVKIVGGTFIMGSPAGEISRQKDEIQHQVTVNPFYMGENEVIQREYEEVMRANPSRFIGASLPVEQVSWFDTLAYCNERSTREGLIPVYIIEPAEIRWNHGANGYRLPTEAEWEYACRAGAKTAFHTGNGLSADQANFDGNYPYNRQAKGRYRRRTTAVRSFDPNAWGLYDMHDNVYEWCWEQYKPYGDTVTLDGVLSSPAVMRGGSWYSEARFLRSANRAFEDYTAKTSYIGFRVVRSVFQDGYGENNVPR